MSDQTERAPTPTEMLIRRLRDVHKCGLASRVCEEAADEIERLKFNEEHILAVHAQNQQELARLRNDVHSCHAGCSRAGCVNERLRAALDTIAARTGSDDPCRALVQIARDALRHNRCN